MNKITKFCVSLIMIWLTGTFIMVVSIASTVGVPMTNNLLASILMLVVAFLCAIFIEEKSDE